MVAGVFDWIYVESSLMNLNDLNESCLFVWKWILVGVIDFLFGAIVLSKVNVLLVLLLMVYTLRREVLEIIDCHLGLLIGE